MWRAAQSCLGNVCVLARTPLPESAVGASLPPWLAPACHAASSLALYLERTARLCQSGVSRQLLKGLSRRHPGAIRLGDSVLPCAKLCLGSAHVAPERRMSVGSGCESPNKPVDFKHHTNLIYKRAAKKRDGWHTLPIGHCVGCINNLKLHKVVLKVVYCIAEPRPNNIQRFTLGIQSFASFGRGSPPQHWMSRCTARTPREQEPSRAVRPQSWR